MKPVELVVINFEMNTENKGGLFRTDTRPHAPVEERDIEVVEYAAAIPLTYEEVYSGQRVTKELPDGIDANSLKVVNYSGNH
jgi:hypothetical protein